MILFNLQINGTRPETFTLSMRYRPSFTMHPRQPNPSGNAKAAVHGTANSSIPNRAGHSIAPCWYDDYFWISHIYISQATSSKDTWPLVLRWSWRMITSNTSMVPTYASCCGKGNRYIKLWDSIWLHLGLNALLLVKPACCACLSVGYAFAFMHLTECI
jgi:hypothetical protein